MFFPQLTAAHFSSDKANYFFNRKRERKEDRVRHVTQLTHTNVSAPKRNNICHFIFGFHEQESI
jgi:hypothetical protein